MENYKKIRDAIDWMNDMRRKSQEEKDLDEKFFNILYEEATKKELIILMSAFIIQKDNQC